MSASTEFIGKGIYTFAEGARFANVTASKARRLMLGHQRRHGDEVIVDEELWQNEIIVDDDNFMSFKDLIELKSIGELSLLGISVQRLRRARNILIDLIEDSYPFSSERLRTDGSDLFIEFQKKDSAGEFKTVEIFSGQQNFTRIVEDSFKDLDFDNSSPRRWWINGRENGVVIDPDRSFGEPVDNETGIPTKILYEYSLAHENNYKKVAMDYCISEQTVKRACDFEIKLAS